MTLALEVEGGAIKCVTLQRVKNFSFTDCRQHCGGFVNFKFTDDTDQEVEIYLDTPMVIALLARLAGLFTPKTES